MSLSLYIIYLSLFFLYHNKKKWPIVIPQETDASKNSPTAKQPVYLNFIFNFLVKNKT